MTIEDNKQIKTFTPNEEEVMRMFAKLLVKKVRDDYKNHSLHIPQSDSSPLSSD